MPPFPADFQLSSLDGTNGFQINGEAATDASGSSVSAAGDVNGDGRGDVLVGAFGADPNGSYSGASYVVFGGAGVGAGGTLNLSSLDGTNGFRISGETAGDRSGISVSAAGDVNGDGVGDIVIGAHQADPNGSNSGASYVVFGGAGVGTGGTLNLSSLDGTNGFQISGEAIYDRSGWSVSAAGDVNGDGIGDLLIGAPYDPNGTSSGTSYVVFGGAGVGAGGTLNLSTLNGQNGFQINGEAAGDRSGISVSAAGDVNGDGVGDLLIGAYAADPNGTNSGASYVVFGGAGVGAGGTLNLSALDGTNGFQISGEAAGDWSGASVSEGGDVNGDGFGDLLIGARYADPNGNRSGESYVVFGGAGVGAGGTLNLPALDGTNGFQISGEAAEDRNGYSVSAAGDVNGDGIGDLIIGARSAPNGTYTGASYVVFGGAGVGAGGTLDLSALDGTNGFQINGEVAGDQSGWSVSAAGDVNGDGFDDVVVGAPFADPNGGNSGASYVVFGHAVGAVGQTLTISPATLSQAEGHAGATNYTFTLTRNATSGAATLTYAVAGSGPNPANAADFVGGVLPSGRVTFADGQNSVTVTIAVAGDSAIEPGEGFTLTVDTPAIFATTGFTATATIADDDTSSPPDPDEPIEINGTPAADTLVGNARDNIMRGQAENDTISGMFGADLIYGNQGNDLVYGNQQGDTLYGGQGDDTLYGGQSEDLVYGNLGNDAVYGNLGEDTLFGGQGNDSLFGGRGNDRLFGNLGDDRISGNLGNDTLSGGLGADRFVFGPNSGTDTVSDFSLSEGDRLDLAGQTYTERDTAEGMALDLSGGGTILLTGIEPANFSSAFFA